jgi:hypothetical protein
MRTGTSASRKLFQRAKRHHRLVEAHADKRCDGDLALRRVAQHFQRVIKAVIVFYTNRLTPETGISFPIISRLERCDTLSPQVWFARVRIPFDHAFHQKRFIGGDDSTVALVHPARDGDVQHAFWIVKRQQINALP